MTTKLIKRYVIFALLVAGVACSREDGSKKSNRLLPTRIRVATSETRKFADEIVALGTLRARESVNVTASVTEKVARIAFHDGQTVTRGQVLVELVRSEEQSRLQQARTQLVRENTELDRVEAMARDKMVSASEHDDQRAKADSAKAALQAIEAQLGDRLVRAPFAGVVGLRQVSRGSLVTPSTIITTLDATDILLADLPLPERTLSQLKIGLQVSLKSEAYPEETFAAQVTAIDGRVNPNTRAVTLRAEVPNPDGKLRPGMLVRAVLAIGERTSTAVPETAIVPRASRVFVYTLTSDKKGGTQVAITEVKVGRRVPGWVEILHGLEPGQKVVVDGTNRVRPGVPVTIEE